MEKINSSSLDITQDNIEKLKGLFPNVVTEGKIDFDMLKIVLGDEVDDNREKYQFIWQGKYESIKLAQSPSFATLRPCKMKSREWDSTENLYIEGDNLEVLKQLQKTYYGKIKMIFIDPPYNTGNDFIYHDDFNNTIENYLEQTNQTNSSNPETSGRYHTDWLNLMYPRLLLSKNLLSSDGVIFISIDDNEVVNLKKICDEIFGESNFVNIISAKTKNIAGASGGGEDKRLKKNIEYILIYVKDYAKFGSFEKVYTKTEIGDLLQGYRDENVSWKYTSVLKDPGEKVYFTTTIDGDGNDIKIYKRKNPVFSSISQIMKDEGLSESETYFKYFDKIYTTAMPQSSIRTRVLNVVDELNKDSLYSIEYVPRSGKNKGNLYEQFYKGEKLRLFAWFKDVAVKDNNNVYKLDAQGTLWDGINLNNLTKEGNVVFENGKKPLDMIVKIVNMIKGNDFIVLDFFSGSATTAHAVLKANLNDNGCRKFIMVQLPEKITGQYRTICDLGQQRIINSGEQIKEEWSKNHIEEGLFADEKEFPFDIGFKVFNLDSTNIKAWDNELVMNEQTLFDQSSEVFKEDRTNEDILYEIMLKYGVFDEPVKEVQVNGKTMYRVGKRHMIVCLDENITNDDVHAIGELKPRVVIFKESGFKNDNDKINAVYNLEKAGIEEVKSI